MDQKLQALSDSFSKSLSNTFLTMLEEKVADEITYAISQELQKIDLLQTIKYHIAEKVQPLLKDAILQSIQHQITGTPKFDYKSIDGSAINTDTLFISGNNVIGGVHKQFQSLGIQDSANDCQLTVLDNGVVVENKLVTKELEVKGPVTIDGDFIVKGRTTVDTLFFKQLTEYVTKEVSDLITPTFFNAYRDEMFDKIEQEGLHLKELTLNGKEIVSDNRLGVFITESNLQSVGELTQLQVKGETLLFNTLYVANKKVGINTFDPSSALTVWDEEVEVAIGKRRQDVAIISAPRKQALIISSGNKENIVVDADGRTTIKKLVVGNIEINSSATEPAGKAKKGTVVFNERPDVGQPLFWVSLDGNRWAPGPIIG